MDVLDHSNSVRGIGDRNFSNESVRCTGLMDIARIIFHLRHELELVNHAIDSLEPLVPRRRGRPRKRISPYLPQPSVPDSVPKRSERRAFGNGNLAASAEDLAREPGTERGRKGANID